MNFIICINFNQFYANADLSRHLGRLLQVIHRLIHRFWGKLWGKLIAKMIPLGRHQDNQGFAKIVKNPTKLNLSFFHKSMTKS